MGVPIRKRHVVIHINGGAELGRDLSNDLPNIDDFRFFILPSAFAQISCQQFFGFKHSGINDLCVD